MGRCTLCAQESPFISEALAVCGTCLARGQGVEQVARVRAEVRARFDLPSQPPASEGGKRCPNCGNHCVLSEGEVGFCGIWFCEGAEVKPRFSFATEALFSFYHDPLPTNCVAGWVCAGGTGAGYPRYAVAPGPERGYHNLAVFYEACNFDCLFCQNWHFRRRGRHGEPLSCSTLLQAVTDTTTCICYFGGDPTPQLAGALALSKKALRNRQGKVLRICWETNGAAAPKLLDEAFKLSLASGGCVKFDIKAWNENVHRALTGSSGEATRRNFARLGRRFNERPEPPPLVASTLLVPGYITAGEVRSIASFIAELNPEIPYALLAFAPQYCLDGLPPTPRSLAEEAREAALDAGLARVRLGNTHLLW